MKTTFYEVQQFRQWWLWVLIFLVFVLPTLYFVSNAEDPEIRAATRTGGVLVAILVPGFVLFFVVILRLTTEITEKSIKVRFFPFLKKEVNWSEIESAKIVDYGFIGGWGIRIHTRFGSVYNVSGSKGLAVVQKNGKKFLIGTQRHAELKKFLEEL